MNAVQRVDYAERAETASVMDMAVKIMKKPERGGWGMMNLTIPIWAIPTVITIAAIAYALTREKGTGGYLQGIETICYLAGAFAVSTVTWIIYAIFK